MWPMSPHWNNNANPSFAQGLHVLLVDHIASSLACMTTMLQHHSYKVTSTHLASVALSTITKQKYNFDLVIANADMPDMDIFSFLRQVGKDIPIIMTSSTKDMKVAMRSLVEGASFFLMKPISKEDIKYLWQHVYRKKKGPGDLVMMKLNEAKRSDDDDDDNEIENDIEGEQSKSTRSREGEENSSGSTNNSTNKKKRIVWSHDMCCKFTNVMSQLDVSSARPKTILKMMNDPRVTRRQVSNRLQKYKAHLQRFKARDKREAEPRIQNFPTGVEFQPLNSSNDQQILDLQAANLTNFDIRGMNTNSGNQRYTYDAHSSRSNMLLEPQLEEHGEEQGLDFDDNDDFMAYLNMEYLNFEDPNALVEKADVTRGGSSSDCNVDQLRLLLDVLEEDNNGCGGEQNFGEVDRYCEWLKEGLFEEDKGEEDQSQDPSRI